MKLLQPNISGTFNTISYFLKFNSISFLKRHFSLARALINYDIKRKKKVCTWIKDFSIHKKTFLINSWCHFPSRCQEIVVWGCFRFLSLQKLSFWGPWRWFLNFRVVLFKSTPYKKIWMKSRNHWRWFCQFETLKDL